MNKVILTGRLTRTPELRHTERGMAVCHFTVANNKYVKGNKKTIFVNIVTFAKTAENCDRFLTKGSKVAIVGELEIRQYEGNDGQTRYMTEILANEVEFLSEKGQVNGSDGFDEPTEIEIEDNELPF